MGTTPNLGLNTFLATDFFDVDDVNANFTAIDSLPINIQGGVANAIYTKGDGVDTNYGTANWYYKKSNKITENNNSYHLVEASTHIDFTDLKCNQVTAHLYRSGTVKIEFPFTFTEVTGLHIDLAHNGWTWPIITSNNEIPQDLSLPISIGSIRTGFKFVAVSTYQETSSGSAIYKQVFITVKGKVAAA